MDYTKLFLLKRWVCKFLIRHLKVNGSYTEGYIRFRKNDLITRNYSIKPIAQVVHYKELN